MLCQVLFGSPQALLLDEPTNHLDLESIGWLEKFLHQYVGTLIVVSHDRHFLNAATTLTLHLDRGKLTLYSGGFDAYMRARSEAARRLEVMAQRQQAERQRLQAFVDRFRAKASKARQAQSRVKALARLEPIVLSATEPPPRIRFPDPPDLRPPLIALDRVSTGYVPGKPVLSRLDLRLDPDDRIALIGANGNGKTTFARLLAGRLEPFSGRMTRSPKLSCGFFAQHQIEEMRPEASAFDHLALLMPDRPPEAVRNRLNKQRDHLFTFLDYDGVDATNNLAERQLRPAVIARKISCGNKTPKGARTWQILASLAATCVQRANSFIDTLARAAPLQAR